MLDISIIQSCLVRILPILIFGAYSAYFTVASGLLIETTLGINVFRPLVYICNGQKVVALSSCFSSRSSFYQPRRLQRHFIDARLGRKPANVHLRLFDSAPISALASSGAFTTASAPPDSPTLASQSLMSNGTAVTSTAPITTTPTQKTMHAAQFIASANERDVLQSGDLLLRLARIRAFRVFQHASPLRGRGWGHLGYEPLVQMETILQPEQEEIGLLLYAFWVLMKSRVCSKMLWRESESDSEGLKFLVHFFIHFCFTAGLTCVAL